MRKEFKYITAVSIIFCFTVIVWTGFQMPWNEEAALYAIYGGGAGFCAAIPISMFIMWRITKKQNRTR